jgi:chromosome segregation ATPase
MERIVSIIITILLGAVFASPALAARPSVFPTRKPTWAIQTRAIPASQDRNSYKRTQSVNTSLSRMNQVSRQRLERYQEFLVKVESRIRKLEAEGKNVDKFNSYITTAEANMQTVQERIQHMEETMAGVDKTGDMKNIRLAVQGEMPQVRNAFTELHATMKRVVTIIREEQTIIGKDLKGTPKRKPTYIPKPTDLYHLD